MNIGLQDRSWPQVIQVVKKKQIRPTVPVPGITKITGQGNTADKFLNNFFRQESKDVTCLAKIFRQVNIDVLFHEVGYRSEEHTSELQSIMRISYAVFCLKKDNIVT